MLFAKNTAKSCSTILLPKFHFSNKIIFTQKSPPFQIDFAKFCNLKFFGKFGAFLAMSYTYLILEPCH